MIKISLFYIGTLFLKRFLDASKMSAKQTDIFNQLSSTFPPETVKKWEGMVTAWNADPKMLNPYQEQKSGGMIILYLI